MVVPGTRGGQGVSREASTWGTEVDVTDESCNTVGFPPRRCDGSR